MIEIKLEQASYGLLSSASKVYHYSADKDNWIVGLDHEVVDSGVLTKNLLLTGGGNDTTGVVEIDDTTGALRQLSYSPFLLQASAKGSVMGTTLEELEEKAKGILDISTQKMIEREFWTGELSKQSNTIFEGTSSHSSEFSVTRYLASADAIDITPTAGTGVKPRLGQALLEGALGAQTIGYKGTIHSPRDVASVLKIKDDKDGVLRTNLDTPFVAGTGYTKHGPDGTEASAGKYWMYATGPTAVVLGDITYSHDNSVQAYNARKNDIEIIAERPAAVVWTTKDVFAVLVDLNLDYS